MPNKLAFEPTEPYHCRRCNETFALTRDDEPICVFCGQETILSLADLADWLDEGGER